MEIIIRLSTHITGSRERDLRKKEKKYKSKGNEMFGQVDHSIKMTNKLKTSNRTGLAKQCSQSIREVGEPLGDKKGMDKGSRQEFAKYSFGYNKI